MEIAWGILGIVTSIWALSLGTVLIVALMKRKFKEADRKPVQQPIQYTQAIPSVVPPVGYLPQVEPSTTVVPASPEGINGYDKAPF